MAEAKRNYVFIESKSYENTLEFVWQHVFKTPLPKDITLYDTIEIATFFNEFHYTCPVFRGSKILLGMYHSSYRRDDGYRLVNILVKIPRRHKKDGLNEFEYQFLEDIHIEDYDRDYGGYLTDEEIALLKTEAKHYIDYYREVDSTRK
jgi:hypothetical protein